MQFVDIEINLNNRGVYFDFNEYAFILMLSAGEELPVAYALSFALEDYKRVKGTEDEREFFTKCTKDAKALLKLQHMIQLKDEVKMRYKKMVQDAALQLDDIELTSSDVKKVLASFLRDRIDDPSSASVKELVDLLRMYQPYLPDDVAEGEFQRHFIQVHEPYNALCTNCNHEISAFKGLSCVCEHCGQKYVWSETDGRFYPEVGKL